MVPTKMKKNTEVMMSAIALPRGENFDVEHVDAHVLVALIGIGAGQHVLHAVHQEHALVHPIGRRVEDEARDDLVVIAEDRDHGPIGDKLADAHVHPFDLVGEPGVQSERRVFVRADLRHVRRARFRAAPLRCSAPRAALACAPGLAAGSRRRPASRPSGSPASANSHASAPDRPRRPRNPILALASRRLGLVQTLRASAALRSRRTGFRRGRLRSLRSANRGARARDILATVADFVGGVEDQRGRPG